MYCRSYLFLRAAALVAMLSAGFLAGDARAETIAVGHWALDDGQSNPSATTAVDSTSPASDGNLVNSATSPDWTTGKLAGALDFDGTKDRVDMGATSELDLTGDLSMAFWLKPSGNGTSKYGHLVGKNQSGGAANDGYFTDLVYTGSVITGGTATTGMIEFGITQGGVITVLHSTSALATNGGDWRHVAVVYQAGLRMAIYLDGELDAELTTGVPAACASAAAQFTLGNLDTKPSATTPSYGFNGALDDVRVYSGALTGAQVAAIVPEPTLVALVLSGLVGLFVWRKRNAA